MPVPPLISILFPVTFSIAVLYIALLFWMAWRLDRLKAAGVAEALSLQEFLFTNGGLTAVRFLFSGRHRQLGDITVSRLVYACRFLFAVYMPMFAVMFGAVLLGSRP